MIGSSSQPIGKEFQSQAAASGPYLCNQSSEQCQRSHVCFLFFGFSLEGSSLTTYVVVYDCE